VSPRRYKLVDRLEELLERVEVEPRWVSVLGDRVGAVSGAPEFEYRWREGAEPGRLANEIGEVIAELRRERELTVRLVRQRDTLRAIVLAGQDPDDVAEALGVEGGDW
jgi:hypothetical protein